MAYEIDFLPVGEETKSGDAILVRYGDLTPGREDQHVVVVDGGFEDTASSVIDHLSRYYNTSHIDLMISTHPDDDHVRGLVALIDRSDVSVGQLWIHKPWDYSYDARNMRLAGVSFREARSQLEKTVANASALHDAAEAKGIPVAEPFTGRSTADRAVVVIGPDRPYYESLLPEFGQQTASSLGSTIREGWAAFKAKLGESIWNETLTDEGTTSATNNSSVVTLLLLDNSYLLLTGDAGIPALERVTHRLRELGIPPGGLRFAQIPHHGSRYNVGPTVLNDLLGGAGEVDRGAAFVSAAKKGRPRHPAKVTLNAFTRRGYSTAVTEGRSIQHHQGAPARTGWTPLSPEPLYEEVEVLD